MSKFINPFTDVCFMRVEDITDIASLSKEDRIRYDESIKVYRDRLAIMEFERMKGYEEGYKEGYAEGRIEWKKEIARNLKQIGMDVQAIAQATGLNQEVIDKL